jgi:hypothetical protein
VSPASKAGGFVRLPRPRCPVGRRRRGRPGPKCCPLWSSQASIPRTMPGSRARTEGLEPSMHGFGNRCSTRLSYVRVMAYFQQKPPVPNSRMGGCRFTRAYLRRRTRVCSQSRCQDEGMVTSPHGVNHCGCPEADHNTFCSFVERSPTTVRRRLHHWQPGNRDKVGVDRLTPMGDIPLWAHR